MYKHILLPTDGSALSDKAVSKAVKIAAALGAKITAVNVMARTPLDLMDEGFLAPEMPALRKRFDKAQASFAKKILEGVRRSASRAGVACDAVTVSGNLPYDGIIRQARKSRCDLIIMASHGRRGLQRLLLGSETTKVLTHSTIPVLVIR